ncbi:MAG: DUF2085 domain-containing protein [Bacteroidota bacterium]
MDISRRLYLALLVLVALWCGSILAAPFLHNFSDQTTPLASLLYKFFARLCHQLDERSFHLAGEQWAVCIRCSSIYFGFLVGLVLFPLVGRFPARTVPASWWLIGASLPMFLDVLLSVAGVHSSTDATRLVTGSLLGVALPFYILPPLFESFNTVYRRYTLSKGEPRYARKTE